jgi:hypothetical protein
MGARQRTCSGVQKGERECFAMIEPSGIQYDDATHIYRVSGRVCLNVTAVWKASGFDPYELVPRRQVEGKAQLGKVVHAVAAMDELGTLDESSVAPEAAPYLASLRRFRAAKKPKMQQVEQIVYSARWQYIGRYDWVGLIDGVLSLVEWKITTKLSPVFGLQLAAYQNARDEHERAKIKRRYVLQLQPDGSMPKLEPYADASDLDSFLAFLHIARWLEKHGL